MLFAKCDAFSRASNLLVVCACFFLCEVVFQGLLVGLVGLLLFVKWDVFSRASDLFLCAACFQVLSLVCLFGQLFFVNCFWASFCFGPVTNPLDCFWVVCFCFFFGGGGAVRLLLPVASLLGRAAAFLKCFFCVRRLICLLCVAAVLLR